MQRAVLEQILRQQAGVTPKEGGFVVTEAALLDLLASVGQEVLTIPKLREIRLEEAYLAASTDKMETFFLEYEEVRALRVKPGAGKA